MSSSSAEYAADVIIVGAGPTGLALAVSLLSRDRNVLVIDKRKDADNTSRAAVVYPGTLELLDSYGISERLVSRGIRSSQFTIRDRDRVLMAVPFGRLPTAFPFALLLPQAATEAELRSRFQQLGGRALQGLEVAGVTQNGECVTIRLATGGSMRTRFVVGADGVQSVVRSSSQIAYEGSSAGESYSLADVRLRGGVPNDELVVYFSSAGHLVVLPLPGGMHRIVAHVRSAPQRPSMSFLQDLLNTRGPKRERAVIHEIVWASRFLTRHALATQYRVGRVLLAGDAAHEHSPLGGQGMNLGIHDAVALGHSLSGALESGSMDLLDSYGDAQRHVAQEVISVADFLTKIATTNEHLREMRNVLLHVLDPMIRTRVAWRLSLLGYQDEALQKRPAPSHHGDSPSAPSTQH
ncbi:MAG: FAD-dependent oxidoreductase [Steroidobacteraceae bacterium]